MLIAKDKALAGGGQQLPAIVAKGTSLDCRSHLYCQKLLVGDELASFHMHSWGLGHRCPMMVCSTLQGRGVLQKVVTGLILGIAHTLSNVKVVTRLPSAESCTNTDPLEFPCRACDH